MQKKQNFKILDRPLTRSPKLSYLSKTKFKMGPPSQNGDSGAVMVAYKTDGSKPDYWYSKDCKNLMQQKHFWSLEKYGLPYLRQIFHNGGDTKTKIDLTKTRQVLIYHSVYGQNQQPLETLFDRRTFTATKSESSRYILLAPKRSDLKTSESDKFFRFLSIDQYDQSGKINVEASLNTLFFKFSKWENKVDPKSTGHLIVYDISSRKMVAEMSRNGVFLEPFSNVEFFPLSKSNTNINNLVLKSLKKTTF